MNTTVRLLFAIAVGPLALVAGGVQAKGTAPTKVVGWSIGRASGGGPGTSSGSKAQDSSSQGYSPAGSAGMGMGAMLMTPNGMIAHNTPAMSVTKGASMGGSTMVTSAARGIGNSVVDTPARGVGNSQGSGGTLDIAAMTHFGVSGLASLSSLFGGSSAGMSSSMSSLLSSSASGKPAATPGGAAGSSLGGGAAKAGMMGMPVNKACASADGSKSGCD